MTQTFFYEKPEQNWRNSEVMRIFAELHDCGCDDNVVMPGMPGMPEMAAKDKCCGDELGEPVAADMMVSDADYDMVPTEVEPTPREPLLSAYEPAMTAAAEMEMIYKELELNEIATELNKMASDYAMKGQHKLAHMFETAIVEIREIVNNNYYGDPR